MGNWGKENVHNIVLGIRPQHLYSDKQNVVVASSIGNCQAPNALSGLVYSFCNLSFPYRSIIYNIYK